MHFPLVRPDEVKVIRKAEVFHAVKPRGEMVEVFKVEVEEPRACIVSQYQTVKVGAFRVVFLVMQELTGQPHPFLVFYDAPEFSDERRNMDGAVGVFHVRFRNINFLPDLRPFYELPDCRMGSVFLDVLFSVFPFLDGRRQATVCLLIQPFHQHGLERFYYHVM